MENTLKTIRQVITVAPLAIITVYITGFLVNFEATSQFTSYLFQFHNYIMPKTLATYTIVSTVLTKRKKIKRKIINTVKDVSWFLDPREEPDNIDGIPHDELLDHLFTVKTFKGKDIEKKWGIPRYIVTQMGQDLERVDILVRGQNNARVLNEEFSRSDIQSMIRGVSESIKLLPLFRRREDGSYSPTPNAKAISARVADMAKVSRGSDAEPVRNEDGTDEEQLPLAPFFTRRPVSSCV